jgi:hypothetical protein
LSVTFTAAEENGKKFGHLRIVINSNALKYGTVCSYLISCHLFPYSFTTALKICRERLEV